MILKRISVAVIAFLLTADLFAQIRLETEGLDLTLDNSGKISGLRNTWTNSDYLNRDTVSYFLSVISGNTRHKPVSARYDQHLNLLQFRFENSKAVVTVKITKRERCLVFEAVKTEPADKVEAIAWGPVYTTISKKIGEVVGVVRDDSVAFGMLVLNAKTLGGPYNKNGTCDGRGSLALPFRSGSSMQAYSINRDRPRHVDAMGLVDIPVKPIHGETAAGSKIALFSCREPKVLDIIEQVVIAEKLPYPTYKGAWTKKAFLHSPSYMISDFRESEIDEIIGYAKRGGFFSLYHEGPFSTWGHYDIDTAYFPDGIRGIKACSEKAKAAGLLFGAHTLTNFISPSDAYVTPLPDRRLAITGFGFLRENINSHSAEIPVSVKEYFDESKNNNMHTVRIGDELIRYNSVTASAPYKLIDCVRGAFGTRAVSHVKNDTVKKLIDHGYKVFFPDISLQREIAVNLAKIYNTGGISHLDFDGHEGCLASGEGDYAYCLFAGDFFKAMDHEFVDGTSNSKPYFWYINTICNWGEPWYGGFNQSMQEYRISNQAMLERNYFPNMLGWYMLTKSTSPEEMEWMLARAAGYNAGFGMVTGTKAVRANPDGMMLLDLIAEWEKTRLSGAFSEGQKERLRDPKNEFHLEKAGEQEWNLFPYVTSSPLIHRKMDKQPGEPTFSGFDFNISSFRQDLQFSVGIKGNSGSVSNIRVQVDNYTDIIIPGELKPGEHVIYNGSGIIRTYDQTGKQRSSMVLTNRIPALEPGSHIISLDAQFTGEEPPEIELIVRYLGNPEKVKRSNLRDAPLFTN